MAAECLGTASSIEMRIDPLQLRPIAQTHIAERKVHRFLVQKEHDFCAIVVIRTIVLDCRNIGGKRNIVAGSIFATIHLRIVVGSQRNCVFDGSQRGEEQLYGRRMGKVGRHLGQLLGLEEVQHVRDGGAGQVGVHFGMSVADFVVVLEVVGVLENVDLRLGKCLYRENRIGLLGTASNVK